MILYPCKEAFKFSAITQANKQQVFHMIISRNSMQDPRTFSTKITGHLLENTDQSFSMQLESQDFWQKENYVKGEKKEESEYLLPNKISCSSKLQILHGRESVNNWI